MKSSKFWALRFAFYMMLEGESGNLFASTSQSRAASAIQADKDLEEWTRRFPVAVDDGRAKIHKVCGVIDPFLPFHSGCEATAGHTFSHYSGARSWPNLTAPVANRNNLCGVLNIDRPDSATCIIINSGPVGHVGDHFDGNNFWPNSRGAVAKCASLSPSGKSCELFDGHAGMHSNGLTGWDS